MEDTELLKELVKDWGSGKLSSYSAMIVVAMAVDPKELSKEDIKWAKDTLMERGRR